MIDRALACQWMLRLSDIVFLVCSGRRLRQSCPTASSRHAPIVLKNSVFECLLKTTFATCGVERQGIQVCRACGNSLDVFSLGVRWIAYSPGKPVQRLANCDRLRNRVFHTIRQDQALACGHTPNIQNPALNSESRREADPHKLVASQVRAVKMRVAGSRKPMSLGRSAKAAASTANTQ